MVLKEGQEEYYLCFYTGRVPKKFSNIYVEIYMWKYTCGKYICGNIYVENIYVDRCENI
jgi:hypothetical protein